MAPHPTWHFCSLFCQEIGKVFHEWKKPLLQGSAQLKPRRKVPGLKMFGNKIKASLGSNDITLYNLFCYILAMTIRTCDGN